jgi:D-alanyl-D-alanine-carboxypeptidase/D-alanyl-D-alanine-endopeptidase
MRIGSITKAFTGDVPAHLVAQGTVRFTDPLTKWEPDLGPGVIGDLDKVTLINLATHSGGFEVPHKPGPDTDPFSTITRDAFADWIKKEPLLFAPGSSSSIRISASTCSPWPCRVPPKSPIPICLRSTSTGPLDMRNTAFTLSDEQKTRFMAGHDFDGEPMSDVATGDVIVGSGGIYSSANDLLKWMKWHLDRLSPNDAEARTLDHALYLNRDGLKTVSGMDESGHMDAMGLAWVGMMAKDDRPFILQKASALQGAFTYIAFAPSARLPSSSPSTSSISPRR